MIFFIGGTFILEKAIIALLKDNLSNKKNWAKERKSWILFMIPSFTQKTFIEHVMHARHCDMLILA